MLRLDPGCSIAFRPVKNVPIEERRKASSGAIHGIRASRLVRRGFPPPVAGIMLQDRYGPSRPRAVRVGDFIGRAVRTRNADCYHTNCVCLKRNRNRVLASLALMGRVYLTKFCPGVDLGAAPGSGGVICLNKEAHHEARMPSNCVVALSGGAC